MLRVLLASPTATILQVVHVYVFLGNALNIIGERVSQACQGRMKRCALPSFPYTAAATAEMFRPSKTRPSISSSSSGSRTARIEL